MFDITDHYDAVAMALQDGQLVFFLGAGANLCNRKSSEEWAAESRYLPSGRELADFLAKSYNYHAPKREIDCPNCGHKVLVPEECGDLAKISQYISLLSGDGPLYSKLHSVFDRDSSVTSLHEFLAELPSIMTERKCANRYQLIVTTNYDDLLERAFAERGQEFDLIAYSNPRNNTLAKFEHWLPEGGRRPILDANTSDVSIKNRPVILKVHGAIDRAREDAEGDSYVITEDDYLRYLAETDISSLIPAKLAATIKRCHFLFLGYSLRDWNLRVFLHKVFSSQKHGFVSWAIQRDTAPLEEKFWSKHDVTLIDIGLEEYLDGLRKRLSGERCEENP